ncbi:MAG TPA: carboxypeptidase-like regulatory domain-containing protein [Methanocella sp.]|nr:carboxypeptidase-like regulatory domain-containing protein [Methanocella sp.]
MLTLKVTLMKMRVLSAIILASLLCGGCITGNQPSPTPATTATTTATATPAPVAQVIYIRGVVLDRDGAPVPYARVALWQGPELVQTPDNPRSSDAAGSFNFTGLQPARYQVAADIQGHKAEVDRRFNESANIQVAIPDYSVSAVTPAPSQGPVAPGMPHFTVTRTGPTTVQVHLDSMGGARSIKGFYVKTPVIKTQEILPVDAPFGESETIEITDPSLSGTVNFAASSWVNGNYAVVIDTTV